jgi:hypothetical protein
MALFEIAKLDAELRGLHEVIQPYEKILRQLYRRFEKLVQNKHSIQVHCLDAIRKIEPGKTGDADALRELTPDVYEAWLASQGIGALEEALEVMLKRARKEPNGLQ